MNVPLGPINWIGLLVVGATLIWSLRCVSGSRSRTSGNPLTWSLHLAGWAMVLFGLLGCLVIVLPASNLPLFGIAACFGLGLVLLLAAMMVNRYRDLETRSLMWLIGSAMGKGLPISQTVRSFAQERRDDTGARAEALAEALEQGVPLDTALRKARLRTPYAILLAARLGNPPAEMHQLVKAMSLNIETSIPDARSIFQRLVYLFILINTGAFVYGFIRARAIPAFRQMLTDYFGTPASPLMDTVFPVGPPLPRLPDTALEYTVAVVTVALLLAYLLILLATLLAMFYYVGWLRWEAPLVRTFLRPLHGATILRALAATISAARPLPQALAQLARHYPVAHVKRRLRGAVAEVNAGAHWTLALKHQKLIDARTSTVLETAQRAGNLAWAARESAELATRTALERGRVMIDLGFAAAILLLAVPVGLIMVAVLQPIVQIIHGLA